MKRKSDSICLHGTQWTQAKRRSLPSGNAGPMMDLELPEAAKLAHSQYFLMTENKNGKVLGCGEEIHRYPEQSRFALRIYNREFYNNGKFKDYVELEMEDFQKIHSHKSAIEDRIKEVHSRETIFELGELKVTVGPSLYPSETAKPTVEIIKAGIKSSMYKETFKRMMSYLPEVNDNYSQFRTRHTEDEKIYEEIVNALAYVKNENRPNAHIRKPEVGRKNGLLTTCFKILVQAKKTVSQKDM